MTFLLCLIFFLSGVAALLFETLWFHQAGLALGNSVWASSLVLAGFMGGLALGNGLAARFGPGVERRVRVYAGLEVVIAASGVGLVFALPALTPTLAPLLEPFLETPWILNSLRLGIAFALLVIPSTAMGATLPILVSELHARDPRFGRALGWLYGWNTLGAVLGALVGEAALIARFGIRGTAFAAAGVNAVAAAVALAVARGSERTAPHREKISSPPLTGRSRALLVAAFLCGGILLALEVVWFRFLILFILGGSLAFALMLAIVLAGIGLGGLVAAAWISRFPTAHRLLPTVALASGALIVGTYALFDRTAAPYLDAAVFHWRDMLALGLPLMFPVSFLSGLLFAWLGEALEREAPSAARSAGSLALANTAGAMVGSLVGGFLLLPVLGIERSIHWLAAAYALAALFMVLGLGFGRGRERILGFAAAVSLAAALLFFPSGWMQERYLAYPIDRLTGREGSQVEAVREGLTETVIYLRKDVYGETQFHRLVTNSHSMSTSALPARRYMQLFVYLPVALHPDPRSALLISFGVGSTAKALTDTASLETIDMVDISRDILELNAVVFPEPDERPLADPRVRVHIEDGRYFLQTTDRYFDIITGEPPPPKAAGIVNLFTVEYFQLVRDRLTDGGIASYWLPVHSLFEPEAKGVIRAFCDVFEDCSLWAGSDLDWILLGTRDARGPVSEESFRRQWRDPRVGPELAALGVEMPEQLGALFLADAPQLREMTRDVPPVDDDHPKRIGTEPAVPSQQRPTYRRWMDVDRARTAFENSDVARRLWPPALREASADYFEFQRLINAASAADYGGAAGRLRRIHTLQTESALETLVQWQLGSNAETHRAAMRATTRGRSGVGIDAELGARALALRDFGRAAELFGRAARRAPAQRELSYYEIYARAMNGDVTGAERRSLQIGLPRGANADDAAVWRFLVEAFALAEPASGDPPGS